MSKIWRLQERVADISKTERAFTGGRPLDCRMIEETASSTGKYTLYMLHALYLYHVYFLATT